MGGVRLGMDCCLGRLPGDLARTKEKADAQSMHHLRDTAAINRDLCACTANTMTSGRPSAVLTPEQCNAIWSKALPSGGMMAASTRRNSTRPVRKALSKTHSKKASNPILREPAAFLRVALAVAALYGNVPSWRLL